MHRGLGIFLLEDIGDVAGFVDVGSVGEDDGRYGVRDCPFASRDTSRIRHRLAPPVRRLSYLEGGPEHLEI